MTRRELVLAILASAEGRPFTPVQIQKATFLVSQNLPNLITEGRRFNFTPYDYGPFDSCVYDEAEILQVEGRAVVAPSAAGNWRTYAASDRGVVDGRALLARLSNDYSAYIRSISEWVRSQGFSQLVRSIYDAYPNMRANSIFRG
jgi:uncharacterized protein